MSGAGRGRFLIAGLMALSLSMGLGSGPASGAMASGPQTRAARSAAGHHVSTKTRVAASTAHARTPRLHVQVQPDRAALDSRTGPAATLTFTVNSTVDTNDVNPGDDICADSSGQCTLRAAIQEADAQPKGGSITINVPAGTYGLKLGMLRLTANNITISGALSSTTTINGNKASAVMGISPTVQARISRVTITGGNAGSGYGGGCSTRGWPS